MFGSQPVFDGDDDRVDRLGEGEHLAVVGPGAAGDHAAAVDVQDARERAGALAAEGSVDPYGYVRSVGRAGHREVFPPDAVVDRQRCVGCPVHLLVQLALARGLEGDEAAGPVSSWRAFRPSRTCGSMRSVVRESGT
nr:hypothetical protein [Streptomyces sp. DH7]